MARRIDCTRKRPIHEGDVERVHGGEREKLFIQHELVAYSEKEGGFFCLLCGMRCRDRAGATIVGPRRASLEAEAG